MGIGRVRQHKVKSFKRDIVGRRPDMTRGRMYRGVMQYAVIRKLSCGHEQDERTGGMAAQALTAICLTCMEPKVNDAEPRE